MQLDSAFRFRNQRKELGQNQKMGPYLTTRWNFFPARFLFVARGFHRESLFLLRAGAAPWAFAAVLRRRRRLSRCSAVVLFIFLFEALKNVNCRQHAWLLHVHLQEPSLKCSGCGHQPEQA